MARGRVQRRVFLLDSGVCRGRRRLTSLVPAGKPTIIKNAHWKHGGQGRRARQPPLSTDLPLRFIAFRLYFDVSEIFVRHTHAYTHVFFKVESSVLLVYLFR